MSTQSNFLTMYGKFLAKLRIGKRISSFGNFICAILWRLWASFIAVCIFCFLFIPGDKMTVCTLGHDWLLSSTPWMCLNIAPGKLSICKSGNANGGNLAVLEVLRIKCLFFTIKFQFLILRSVLTCLVGLWRGVIGAVAVAGVLLRDMWSSYVLDLTNAIWLVCCDLFCLFNFTVPLHSVGSSALS